MIHMQDKMEKLLSSTEEKDREKEETEEEGSGEENGGEEKEEEGQAYDDDEKADREEEAEETVQAPDRPEKDPLPAQAKDKKQTDVLNLNNEVVKMRKEVKRVRALIIRKLTRQIGALKKKKGKEAEIEKNQRRAARLLEEVHAMKVLTPDLVTKTALQKKLNFEEVCKNTQSSITDRAVARIATHPQFNKKIENIKAAVKAFKEERMKAGKQAGKEKAQNKCGQVNSQLPDKRGEKPSEKKEEDASVQLKEMSDNNEDVEHTKDEAKPEIDIVIGAESADTANVLPKQIPESKRVEQASAKLSNRKDPVKNEPQCKDPGMKQNVAVHKNREEEQVSELESSDEEEKEYFDDSTEERFHKQSSQSEESDDDFFVGKVSKFKKRRKQKVVEGERKVKQWQEVKGESNDKVKTSDKVQRELDELESRLKSKATSLQSVFCSSLSGSKQAAGRGRGNDKFRGQRKPNSGTGFNRDFRKQSKFQKQVSGEERNSGSKYSKPCPEGRWQETEEKSFASAGRGRGGGRGRSRDDVIRQNMPKGQGAISHQLPQQALHPSWEASKKRKEQQGQIMAFQGKKIKFDDDDE